MSVLAARSLTEVLVSLGTNVFFTVLIWGFLLGLLLSWLQGSFRLLNFLQLWFFQKKKRARLKLEGSETDWIIWSGVSFLIFASIMKLELDWITCTAGLSIIFFLIKPLIKPLIEPK
jgi:hypothetical protein